MVARWRARRNVFKLFNQEIFNQKSNIMKNQEKLAYEAPEMKVLVVELEQGIAAASSVGSSTPSINDWGSGRGDGGSWDGE